MRSTAMPCRPRSMPRASTRSWLRPLSTAARATPSRGCSARPGVDAPLTAHWLLSDAVPLSRIRPVLYLNMALQGPFVVVADSPAVDVVAALRAEGAFPIIEAGWADAAAALSSVEPEAIVLAEPCTDQTRAAALAKALAAAAKKNDRAFTPIVARTRDDGTPILPDALVIAANAPVERLNRRLISLLRIRALHATVLRRITTLASRGELPPELPSSDPLDDATVLL